MVQGGYTNQPTTEKGQVITFSDTTTSDSIFYQPYDFVGYSHVQVLKPRNYIDKWTRESLIFVTVIFKKKASLMNYDYVNKFTRNDALKLKIKLPVTDLGDPDFRRMETYVKQLESREREFKPFIKLFKKLKKYKNRCIRMEKILFI